MKNRPTLPALAALAFAVAALALLQPSPLAAQRFGMLTTIEPAKLVGVLKDMGMDAKDDSEGDTKKVLWMLGDQRCFFFFPPGGESIQFYYGVTGTDVTLQDINTWNRDYRYSRAYMDDDGDPILELDLDLAGGISEGRLKDFVTTCQVSFDKWRSNIISKKP
ncbi:MAG: YbjN domain-containing protein [Deltaproteobacteria bacterium]|jgi:hypothetical protein|nr:YbjN domain-containing protein [Deltaproteobacteria bacterium]